MIVLTVLRCTILPSFLNPRTRTQAKSSPNMKLLFVERNPKKNSLETFLVHLVGSLSGTPFWMCIIISCRVWKKFSSFEVGFCSQPKHSVFISSINFVVFFSFPMIKK